MFSETPITSYEPYIPSVKMLADEVSAQNESLSDYGLYNKFEGSVTYNYWYNKENGEYQSSGTSATLTNKTNCSGGNIVRVMCPSATNVSIVFYNSSNEFISGTDKDGTDVQFIAPTNASYCRINFYKSGGFGGNIGKIGVYINNAIDEIKNDLSDLKDGTTPAAKAVADEDGNNIKSTYAKKTETLETATEDVNVVLNSDLFDSTYSDITCVRIGKLCVLSFTIRVKNTISSTIDNIVLMSIVGTKYQPKNLGGGTRQIFQGFAVGNYDENGKQSQSLNNTVRIITRSDSNYTEIITRDKDRLNWSGYVQGQIMWVTD